MNTWELEELNEELEQLDEEVLAELPKVLPALPAEPGQVDLGQLQGRLLDPRRPGTEGGAKRHTGKLPEHLAGDKELHHVLLVEQLQHLLLGKLLEPLHLILLAELQEGDHLFLQDVLLHLLQIYVPDEMSDNFRALATS